MTGYDRKDSITVLRANGKRLAKLIATDGSIIDYDNAYRFDGRRFELSGLDDIRALLGRVLDRPDCCVVRGELIAGPRVDGMRRLVFRDAGRNTEPTLRDVPRRWLAIDHDGVARSPSIDPVDLLASAKKVFNGMPGIFRQTACIVQATAGHGIKPGIRLRTWWWCDRPMTGRELKIWLRGKCDLSVFGACQPIYTARPIFGPGRVEHLPYRLDEYPGINQLRCPSEAELIPPPRVRTPPPAPTSAKAGAYALQALASAARRICNAGDGDRHATCRNEAQSLARLVYAGLIDAGDVSRVLTTAFVQATGRPATEAASIISWAMKNPSGAAVPGRVA